MAPNPEPSGFSKLPFHDRAGQTRASQRKDSKGRKFFQQLQPTFAVDVPPTTSTNLEFLDNFDPGKDTVVRKKAREWVNKNREMTTLGGQATPKSTSKTAASRVGVEAWKEQIARRQSQVSAVQFSPPKSIGASSVDPFGILPNIGRNFDHIIKYCRITINSAVVFQSDKRSPFFQLSRRNSVFRWYVCRAFPHL